MFKETLKKKLFEYRDKISLSENKVVEFDRGFQAAFDMLWPLVEAMEEIKLQNDQGCWYNVENISAEALNELEEKLK